MPADFAFNSSTSTESVTMVKAVAPGSAAPGPGWTSRTVEVDAAAMIFKKSQGVHCALLHAKTGGWNAEARVRTGWWGMVGVGWDGHEIGCGGDVGLVQRKIYLFLFLISWGKTCTKSHW